MRLILSILCLTFILFSCGDKKDANPTSNDFDRGAMLTFYADSMIVPSFKVLQIQTNNLNAAVGLFAQSVTSANLLAAQSAYKSALMAWQYASPFDIEDALGSTLSNNINTFPASTAKIETAISAGNSSLANFDRDARGFQAIDYLLFKLDDDNSAIIASFADTNRVEYLRALANNIKTQVDLSAQNWVDNRASFIANDGTSAGSSVSELYNTLLLDFETLKNYKLGLPLGKRPGQTKTEVERLECYYSGYSLEMAKANMKAVEQTWHGRTGADKESEGFVKYLKSVSGGEGLVNETLIQLNAVNSMLDLIPAGRFSVTIENNLTSVDNAYTEILKLTHYLKSNMSSLLGIAITYSSGDGD